jgi:hypothetical protein
METTIKPYQKWFNNYFGYREDYKQTFWKYLRDWGKKYLLHFRKYRHRPGNGIGNTYELTFFSYTFAEIKFAFEFSTYVFFKTSISFSICKPNLQFKLTFQRNTAS